MEQRYVEKSRQMNVLEGEVSDVAFKHLEHVLVRVEEFVEVVYRILHERVYFRLGKLMKLPTDL